MKVIQMRFLKGNYEIAIDSSSGYGSTHSQEFTIEK